MSRRESSSNNVNIKRIGETLAQTGYDVVYDNHHRSSDHYDISVRKFFQIATMLRMVVLLEFHKIESGFIEAKDKIAKRLDGILMLHKEELSDDISLFTKLYDELTYCKEQLNLDKNKFLGSEAIIASNSKSDEHLVAFNAQSVSDIPPENYVIKFKNYFKMHIRVGIKLEKKTFEIINVGIKK